MVCQMKDGMGKGIILIDGHCMCVLVTMTMPVVSPRDIQGQHHLNGHIHDWGAEGSEHFLSSSLC